MTKLTLDASARLILMQFQFSNPDVIPEIIRCQELESRTAATERRQRSNGGCMVIQPTENVSVEHFSASVESSGYTLVDGVYQPRRHPQQPSRIYHMVRFIFSRNEYAEMSEQFRSVQSDIRTELDEICKAAFWRVRAFSNPFYRDGEEIAGFRSLSFNFEVRVPRFLPDGNHVLQRRKDAEGRKYGDPIPLEPTHTLTASEGVVTLT